MPAPGPGGTMFVGFGILAGEFRRVAEGVVVVELKVRALGRVGEQWWGRVGPFSRALCLIIFGGLPLQQTTERDLCCDSALILPVIPFQEKRVAGGGRLTGWLLNDGQA